MEKRQGTNSCEELLSMLPETVGLVTIGHFRPMLNAGLLCQRSDGV